MIPVRAESPWQGRRQIKSCRGPETPRNAAAGIVRVVEFGQRALLVMHENDRVDRIGESVSLQIIENVIRSLVDKVPWDKDVR